MNAPLIMQTPVVQPLCWEVTRTTIDDIWALYVQPSIDAGGFQTPECRALASILREVWAALPDNPEPRRYQPTLDPT